MAISLIICQTVCGANENLSNDEISSKYRYTKPAIDSELVEREADEYFYEGIENIDKTTREAYLMKALEKYMLLLELNMYDFISCTQIAVIHYDLGNEDTALEYFKRAVNLGNLNPFANFHFAEYYFSKKEYRKALNYYLIAYDNGYDDHYQVSLRLAIIYEKLGDFKKARKYYQIAKRYNPELQEGVDKKLEFFKTINYSRSDYK